MLKTVVVGRIGAPHGVRGWVKIQSFTEPAENLFAYPLLLRTPHDGFRAIEVEQAQQHGSNFIAKLVDIDDRDQAALLTNVELVVRREDLPELDDAKEHYWTDIIGLDVYNQDDVLLGKAVDFFDTGANEVLVVRGEKEYLIPFVKEMYITKVDLESGRLYVDWDAEF